MDRKYTTKDLSEMMGVEAVTVRKYALALEDAKYSFERDERNHRLYNDRDIMALQQLKTLRERSGMNVETAANVVASKHLQASNSVMVVEKNASVAVLEQYAEQYAVLESKMEQLIEMMRAQQQVAAALPDPHEEKQRRLTERMTEWRVQSQLETEALQQWSEKPEAERMKRVGWFRKEEDAEARREFVRLYIREHFEARMRNEYEF